MKMSMEGVNGMNALTHSDTNAIIKRGKATMRRIVGLNIKCLCSLYC